MKGIYKITNKVNGKVYIGESYDLEHRWMKHIEDLSNNRHSNIKLQSDWNKYGLKNFNFETEKVIKDNISIYLVELILLIYEYMYINKYDSINNGYNINNTLERVICGYEKLKIINSMNRKDILKLINEILYNMINNNYEYNKNFKINNDNFIKINKNIIKHDSKYIMLYIYLYFCVDKMNRCKFTLGELIKESGYISKSGKGKSNDIFKNLLLKIHEDGIIDSIDLNNINTIDTTTEILCNYNEIYYSNENYINFPINLYKKILNIKSKKKIDYLKFSLYIFSHMGVNITYAYIPFERIQKEINFSKGKLVTIVDEMKKCGLLFSDNIGLYKTKNGTVKYSTNIYSFDKLSMDIGLLQSKEYIHSQGYKPLNKRQKKLVQQINGLKGVIKREKNKGKDVSKSEEKLKELKNKLNDKCDISIDELNKKIEVLNKECDRLGIDGIEPTDTFDINELIEIKEFLEDSIKRSHKELKELFK